MSETKSRTKMTLVGGIDVGNGYLKGLIRNEIPAKSSKDGIDVIDMPSGVALVTRPNSLPIEDQDAPKVCADDFYNDLDVSFTSPMISNTYRHLFGRRSLSTDGAFEEFSVTGRLSKAEQELSKVLVLGCFAGKAVRDYVSTVGKLPSEEIEVRAHVAIALPIDEYMRFRTSYSANFKSGAHIVTVHNFETPVTVRIVFEDVVVMAEGASAQWAIVEKGPKLMNLMLDDLRTRGFELGDISAEEVLAAKNTIGIDVGEGTVNFPVFTNGRFNADASATFGEGYGTVLTRALDSMEAEGFNAGFSSRKQLAEFLQTKPSTLKRNFYNGVKEYVDREAQFFAKSVAEQFGQRLLVVGALTEVCFVFGGGSGPIKDILYPVLLAKVTEMNSSNSIPILYLDSTYSRVLNREGLFSIAEAAYREVASK